MQGKKKHIKMEDEDEVDLEEVELKLAKAEQDNLMFDGQNVEKSKISELINKVLNHFMVQKIDRIKDSPNELIGRFEQNENAIKDHLSLASSHQVVGAIQMKVFAAEINKMGADSQSAVDIRKRMYVKTFRISQYTTIE